MNLTPIDWGIVLTILVLMIFTVIASKTLMRSVADFLAAGRSAGRYVITMGGGIAGLGAITHKFSGNMLVKDLNSGETLIVYPTGSSEDKFMLTYGGGLITMLTQRLGLEFGLTSDLLFVGSTKNGTHYEQSPMIFDFNLGLIAVF